MPIDVWCLYLIGVDKDIYPDFKIKVFKDYQEALKAQEEIYNKYWSSAKSVLEEFKENGTVKEEESYFNLNINDFIESLINQELSEKEIIKIIINTEYCSVKLEKNKLNLSDNLILEVDS